MHLTKKLVPFFIFLFSTPFLYSQNNLDCSSFKTGKFHVMQDGKVRDLVKRTKKYQIETNLETGAKVKMKIDWIDDCRYNLIYIKGNKKFLKGMSEEELALFKEDVVITLKKIEGNVYTYSCIFPSFPNFYMEDTLIKIK